MAQVSGSVSPVTCPHSLPGPCLCLVNLWKIYKAVEKLGAYELVRREWDCIQGQGFLWDHPVTYAGSALQPSRPQLPPQHKYIAVCSSRKQDRG